MSETTRRNSLLDGALNGGGVGGGDPYLPITVLQLALGIEQQIASCESTWGEIDAGIIFPKGVRKVFCYFILF